MKTFVAAFAAIMCAAAVIFGIHSYSAKKERELAQWIIVLKRSEDVAKLMGENIRGHAATEEQVKNFADHIKGLRSAISASNFPVKLRTAFEKSLKQQIEDYREALGVYKPNVEVTALLDQL